MGVMCLFAPSFLQGTPLLYIGKQIPFGNIALFWSCGFGWADRCGFTHYRCYISLSISAT